MRSWTADVLIRETAMNSVVAILPLSSGATDALTVPLCLAARKNMLQQAAHRQDNSKMTMIRFKLEISLSFPFSFA